MDCLSAQMDGFALPPFESACIFRDKDIIRYSVENCFFFLVESNVVSDVTLWRLDLWVPILGESMGCGWLCRTPMSDSRDANAMFHCSVYLPFSSGKMKAPPIITPSQISYAHD